jgi:hypothetical protein
VHRPAQDLGRTKDHLRGDDMRGPWTAEIAAFRQGLARQDRFGRGSLECQTLEPVAKEGDAMAFQARRLELMLLQHADRADARLKS